HDQVEAMTMGDRVAVLKDGYLQQVDTPRALYHDPVNIFVAAFIGSPAMNLYDAKLDRLGDAMTPLHLGSIELEVPASVFAERPQLREHAGHHVVVGIRPEEMEDVAFAPDHTPGQRFRSTARLVESLGAEVLVHFDIDAAAATTGDPDVTDEIALGHGAASCIARFNPRTATRVGD